MTESRSGHEVGVLADAEAVARAAADAFVAAVTEAVAARGSCVVALTSGPVSRLLYRELAAEKSPGRALPWASVRVVIADERPGPSHHPEGAYRLAYDELLSHVPIPPGNVIRFFSEGEDLDFVVAHAEGMLREAFRLGPRQAPRFDVVVLEVVGGVARGVHPAPPERAAGRVLTMHLETAAGRRLALAPGVLREAGNRWFLAAGSQEADAVGALFAGAAADSGPIAAVHPPGARSLWLLDERAAAALPGPGR